MIDYPQQDDDLDPEAAKFLYEQHGAILVLEGLPVGSEFGIDLAAFKVANKFKGLKMIPPGLHFVFASASSDHSTLGAQCGPRVGFYHEFASKELLVRRWCAQEEDFDESFAPPEEHVERYRSNLRDLDRFLGAYPYSSYRTFLNLTDRITRDTLSELLPSTRGFKNFKIRSVPYLVRRDEGSPRTTIPPKRTRTSGQPEASHLLPELQPARGTAIQFSRVPNTHKDLQLELDPQQVTQFNLDSTQRLEHTFGGSRGRRRLLAEFQFAFVTLLMAHVYSSFEQWRKLLVLVCCASGGLSNYPDFYVDFLRVLRCQLERMHSDDLFSDLTDANNLVRHYLDVLFQNCCAHSRTTTGPVWQALLGQVDDLKRLLTDKFGFHFKSNELDDLDEDQPVVVDGDS